MVHVHYLHSPLPHSPTVAIGAGLSHTVGVLLRRVGTDDAGGEEREKLLKCHRIVLRQNHCPASQLRFLQRLPLAQILLCRNYIHLTRRELRNLYDDWDKVVAFQIE